MTTHGNGGPVEAVDYAKLNAAYGVLFVAVVAAARRRRSPRSRSRSAS